MLHAMTGASRTVFHRRLSQHCGSRLLDRTRWTEPAGLFDGRTNGAGLMAFELELVPPLA